MLHGKKNVVLVVSLLLVIALLALGGSWAWFSSQVESVDNEFTAGTLDLEISNDGDSWGETATATWQSPSNWAPGETFTSTVRIRNVGTIDADFLGGDMHNYSRSNLSDGSNLADVIEVATWEIFVPGYGWIDLLDPEDQNYQGLVGDKMSPLTLDELMKSYHSGEPAWAEGRVQDEFGGWVSYTTDWVHGNGYDTVPEGTPAIAAGSTYRMRFAFKFMESAGNEYQGDSCSFDISYTAVQDLSQLP